MMMELINGDGVRKMGVVAFLGPPSSYSHQAALQAFPDKTKYDLQAAVDIDAIFEVVQREEVDFGVVPFENSTNGAVIFTLDNLANRYQTCADVVVCGEAYVDVHHYLVGHKGPPPSLLNEDGGEGSGTCTPTAADPHPLKPRTKPLGSLKHIQRVYSHPQAWGQCSVFLSTYLKGVETFDVSSTSRAAEMAKEDKTGTTAAISSEIAASHYGLDVLGKCIEDREDNTTRFFILRKVTAPDMLHLQPAEPSAAASKSLVSFTVPHHAPGALANVLDYFRKAGLNLTSINSRPSLIRPFQYLFFVEFEGHREVDPDGSVKDALEGVGRVAESWTWLGSWLSQRVMKQNEILPRD